MKAPPFLGDAGCRFRRQRSGTCLVSLLGGRSAAHQLRWLNWGEETQDGWSLRVGQDEFGSLSIEIGVAGLPGRSGTGGAMAKPKHGLKGINRPSLRTRI